MIGAIAKFYGISFEHIEEAMRRRYGKKESVREMNKKCLQEGYDIFTSSSITLETPSPLQQQDKILIDGNSALAL